jgi:hypothetical protein
VVLLLVPLATGCGNQSARAPNPPHYEWPDSFEYRVRNVEETERGTQAVVRLEEWAALRLAVRNDRYLVWNDSVSKVVLAAGRAAAAEPVRPEDTLRYLVRLGRFGELLDVEPDCDPTVGACAAALPSALPMELRRIFARLPVWWPPVGDAWADTLDFDDLPRPGAARGDVLTVYRVAGDTAISGRRYWVVSWHSARQAWRPVGAAMVPDPVTHENGDVLVDQTRLLPVYARWHGALPASARAAGVTETGYRGRAWLAGSVFDSLAVAR